MSLLRRAVAAIFIAGAPQAARAQTYSLLYSFAGGADGAYPRGAVIDRAGQLYGTTTAGGTAGAGTVFEMDPSSGAESVLHSFAGGKDGNTPFAGLVAHGSALFGTTATATGNMKCIGGACGTVFRVNAGTGAEKVLHRFDGTDGLFPEAPLIYQNGLLYGTTPLGGASGRGTVFAINPATRALTTLYSFSGGADGDGPQNGLVYVGGLLYGTTEEGGTKHGGVVFAVDSATGAETVLHSFAGGTDGAFPDAGVIFEDGILYGATAEGGTGKHCRTGCGTLFSVNVAQGTETVLYSFQAGTRDGLYPQATPFYHARALYGTTTNGGEFGGGTIYRFDLDIGREKLLHDFGGSSDGIYPIAPLIYDDGAFYGTASEGAGPGFGAVFKLVP